MQATQTRQYAVHYQYWMSFRNSYETDLAIVDADSAAAARKVAMDEMGILEILNVVEL